MEGFQLNLLNWGCKTTFFKICKIFIPICTRMCIKNTGKCILITCFCLQMFCCLKSVSQLDFYFLHLATSVLWQLCYFALSQPAESRGSKAAWVTGWVARARTHVKTHWKVCVALCKRCCIVLWPKIASPNRKRERNGVRHANWRNVVSCWAGFILIWAHFQTVCHTNEAANSVRFVLPCMALTCELCHLWLKKPPPSAISSCWSQLPRQLNVWLAFPPELCLQPYVDGRHCKYPWLHKGTQFWTVGAKQVDLCFLLDL